MVENRDEREMTARSEIPQGDHLPSQISPESTPPSSFQGSQYLSRLPLPSDPVDNTPSSPTGKGKRKATAQPDDDSGFERFKRARLPDTSSQTSASTLAVLGAEPRSSSPNSQAISSAALLQHRKPVPALFLSAQSAPLPPRTKSQEIASYCASLGYQARHAPGVSASIAGQAIASGSNSSPTVGGSTRQVSDALPTSRSIPLNSSSLTSPMRNDLPATPPLSQDSSHRSGHVRATSDFGPLPSKSLLPYRFFPSGSNHVSFGELSSNPLRQVLDQVSSASNTTIPSSRLNRPSTSSQPLHLQPFELAAQLFDSEQQRMSSLTTLVTEWATSLTANAAQWQGASNPDTLFQRIKDLEADQIQRQAYAHHLETKDKESTGTIERLQRELTAAQRYMGIKLDEWRKKEDELTLLRKGVIDLNRIKNIAEDEVENFRKMTDDLRVELGKAQEMCKGAFSMREDEIDRANAMMQERDAAIRERDTLQRALDGLQGRAV